MPIHFFCQAFKSRLTAITLTLFIWMTNPACALQKDRNEPINLSANKAEFNDVSQEYVLSGNAIILKGSMRISGDRAVIIVDPEGYQQISVIAPASSVAKFSQKIEGPGNEVTECEGDFIMYDTKTEILVIRGNAHAKKIVGTSWRDKISAQEIYYDLATEKYQAVSQDSKQPVKTIIAPQRAKDSIKLFDAK